MDPPRAAARSVGPTPGTRGGIRGSRPSAARRHVGAGDRRRQRSSGSRAPSSWPPTGPRSRSAAGPRADCGPGSTRSRRRSRPQAPRRSARSRRPTSSKAGLEMLCMMAADELGASNIRVNTVRPGLTRTDLVEALTAPGPVLDDYLACMPLRRVGEPDEVAALVRFLVGPEAAWITGQNIGIDGGHALRRGPDLSGMLVDVFGANGLRGVVGT